MDTHSQLSAGRIDAKPETNDVKPVRLTTARSVSRSQLRP